MLSKQKVQQARDNQESILMSVVEECFLCKKSDYWTILIVKVPEWVCQCLDCAEEYPDNKVYKWVNWCWQLYKIGEWFI